jgi:hypothetical protein
MSYKSTLACLAVGFLALAVVAGVVRNQPAQVFCLTDHGHCAPVTNFDFTALSTDR